MIVEVLRRVKLVLAEMVWSFDRNSDIRAASSLTFNLAIALIPALFLITSIAGAAVGSSQSALAQVQDVLTQLLPGYSEVILREVRHITSFRGAIGVVNFLVLILTVTPLVANLREVLGAVFRRAPGRPFLLEKLLDLALTIIFLVGVTAIAVAGVVLPIIEHRLPLPVLLGYAETIAPFLFLMLTVFLLYLAFSKGMPKRYLLAGALTATGLWFVMRPLFHLFIAYNPGYGFAFGSFKSLFVVLIWIYYSLIVFLLGAELAAALDRKEIAVIRRLMEGKRNVPRSVAERYLVRHNQGSMVFREGDAGEEMFLVLAGSVSIRKGDREIVRVGAGQYFGAVSFLLDAPHIASAEAMEDTELVVINRRSVPDLMHESPEIMFAVLQEMASRLREVNRLIE
jgi:membrane protein